MRRIKNPERGLGGGDSDATANLPIIIEPEAAQLLVNNNTVLTVDYAHAQQTFETIRSGNPIKVPSSASDPRLVVSKLKDKGREGDFDPVTGEVRINYTDDAEQMQKRLQHELGHYYNVLATPLTQREKIVNYMTTVSRKFALPISGWPIASVVGLGASEQLDARSTAHTIVEAISLTSTGASGVAALGAIGFMAAYRYGKNEREQIAHQAMEHDLPPVFTTESSDPSQNPS
jgi:hypothetical protein